MSSPDGPGSPEATPIAELPFEVLARVCDLVDVESRADVWTASKQAQAGLAPAVERLLVHLDTDRQPVQSPFHGLHPDVKPRQLTITQPSQDGQDCSAIESQLHAVSTSAHCSHVRNLHINKVNLYQDTAQSLGPLLQRPTLVELHLSHCSIHPSSLPFLAACKQLQVLHLDHVDLLPGAEEAFAALAGLPPLKLVMDSVTVTDTESQLPGGVGLLRGLGACVTHLEYIHGWEAVARREVVELLHIMGEGHLSNLVHLRTSIKGRLRACWPLAPEDFEGVPERCASLQHLKLQGMMPRDLQTFGALMAMPALRHLHLQSAMDLEDSSLHALRWPAGKPPMSSQLACLPANLLYALPLQHIGKLSCEMFSMEAPTSSTPAQERDRLSSILQLLQRKGTVLEVLEFIGHFHSVISASGLSALSGPDCHLKPKEAKECCLSCMQLDACDVQAVATWGSSLATLTLGRNLLLTPAAWSALTASNFPTLQQLRIHSSSVSFGMMLLSLCLDWPRDRPLSLVVIYTGPSESKVQFRQFRGAAAGFRASLQAFGRNQIEVVIEQLL